jgi:hypothetical protein
MTYMERALHTRRGRSTMRVVAIIMISLAAAVSAPARATDEVGFRGMGPRLGVSVNPDQVFIGLHADYGHFAEHIRLQPNLEVGVSNHLTLIAVNAEAAYRFAQSWDVWTPYLGGGLGLFIYSHDRSHGHGHRTDTDLGLNILGGIDRGLANGNRFFLEAKFGLADAPDAKFTVGWTFY